MDLGRQGQMALRCSVYPIVNSFTRATRIGIAHQALSVEEAGLLKVAAGATNPHSGRLPQAQTHLLWAKNGAALPVLGVTT